MNQITKKEIMARMEQLESGERLLFLLNPTFGSQVVVVEHNPQYPEKKQKKFLMRLGKNQETALIVKPLIATDKAKKVADWVASRAPQWLEETPPREKAA